MPRSKIFIHNILTCFESKVSAVRTVAFRDVNKGTRKSALLRNAELEKLLLEVSFEIDIPEMLMRTKNLRIICWKYLSSWREASQGFNVFI